MQNFQNNYSPEALLQGLNPAQQEAVTSDAQVLRVIAGAGSGKTKVLTERIKWLINVEHLAAEQILAITFTNKAAAEMRSRLMGFLPERSYVNRLWIGTFHATCLRILRLHANLMGWDRNFTVMNRADQEKTLRELLAVLGKNPKEFVPKEILARISRWKERGLRADMLAEERAFSARANQDYIAIYREYEKFCRANARADFDELILLTIELLEQEEMVRNHFHRLFRAVFVDEFQDTNELQMRLIQLLTADDAKLFVVGDEDQSIYGWRGAQIENILYLERRYPNLHTVSLEENYRSTGNILQAANAVIANNKKRLGKKLWTAAADGEKIRVISAFNEKDEAEKIAEIIKKTAREKNRSWREFAILYRRNSLSRNLEYSLSNQEIPYRIYGGLRFFDRQEIKDALAYLRLLNHPEDNQALERIINRPKRSIGEKTIDDLRLAAWQNAGGIWNLLTNDLFISANFPKRAKALAEFTSLIKKMQAEFQEALRENDCRDAEKAGQLLTRALEIAIHSSGLWDFYSNENDRTYSETRSDNLEELVSAAKEFALRNPIFPDNFTGETTPDAGILLDNFLASCTLDAGDYEADAGENRVQLMTIHSAKGLEFPFVFVAGCEDGIFPSYQALQSLHDEIEEERRLCYVAFTRAREELSCSFAHIRYEQGREHASDCSRFLKEIPENLLSMQGFMPGKTVHPASAPNANFASAPRAGKTAGKFAVGKKVEHSKYGRGVIKDVEGEGERSRVLVRFNFQIGDKWLVLKYANLQLVE